MTSAAKPLSIRWPLMAFAFFGGLAFVAGGAWLMVISGDAIMPKIIGMIGIVFFGCCSLLVVWRIATGRRMYVGRDGFGFGTRTSPPALIPWSDVEDIYAWDFMNQKLVAVRLSSYDAYLSQLSDAEARGEVAKFKFVTGVGAIAQPFAGGDHARVLPTVLEGSAAVRSLADILAYNRRTFGAEILLSMYDRDRGPDAFVRYLNSFRA